MTKVAAMRPVIAPEAPRAVVMSGSLPIIEPTMPPSALAAKISGEPAGPMIGSSRNPTSAIATQLPIRCDELACSSGARNSRQNCPAATHPS